MLVVFRGLWMKMDVSAEVTWYPVALFCGPSSNGTRCSLLYTFKQGAKMFDQIDMVEWFDPGEKVFMSAQLPIQQ